MKKQMPTFEEMRKVGFDYAEKVNSQEPTQKDVSEKEVKALTESILEFVKGFNKSTLKVIKYSKDPVNEFFRICDRYEKLAPNSKIILELRCKLYVFASTHGCLGTVVGILTTVIGTVVRLVLTGVQLLFKVVGAVLVALANAGYRIVQEIKAQVKPWGLNTSKNEGGDKLDKMSKEDLAQKVRDLELELNLANSAK